MDEKSEQELGVKAAHILYPLFLGQAIGILLTGITFVVVARILQPSEYGIYIFAFSFSSLVNGFAGFGIGAYFSNILAKFAYRRDGEGILRELYSGYIIAFIVGTILTLIGFGLSGYVAGLYHEVGITQYELMLSAATIIFMLINAISVSALIGLSRTGLGSLCTAIVDFVQLVLSVYLGLKFGVVGAIAAMLIGYMVGAALALIFVLLAASKYISIRIIIPSRAHLWNVFLTVTPIAWTNFINVGTHNIAILLLALYGVTAAELGNYGAASKGLALLTMIYTALGSGLFPIFTTAKAIDSDGSVNATYNKIIRFALLLMLPIVIFVGVMAVPGLQILVGGSYSSAPFYLLLLSIGTCIGLFAAYVGNLIISEGYTRNVLKVDAISALIQLVFILILAPVSKIVGVIISIFYIGNLAEVWLFGREAGRLFAIKFEYRKILTLLVANAIVGLLLYGLLNLMTGHIVLQKASYTSAVEIIMGSIFVLLIYPPVLVGLRALTLHEIHALRHTTARLGKVSILFTAFFNYSERIYNLMIGI